jgi:hypothetical protein
MKSVPKMLLNLPLGNSEKVESHTNPVCRHRDRMLSHSSICPLGIDAK